MIAQLIGIPHPHGLDELIVDVGGVGYEVHVPTATAGQLRPDDDGRVTVFIHTSVREDAIQLFGFASAEQRTVFRKLIAVNKVGPKLALAVLSELSSSEVVDAVRAENVPVFVRVPGIGKKMAQRLVLELATAFDDMGPLRMQPNVVRRAPTKDEDVFSDLRSALVNLEYKPAAIDRAIDELRPTASPDEDFNALLRRALQTMRG